MALGKVGSLWDMEIGIFEVVDKDGGRKSRKGGVW